VPPAVLRRRTPAAVRALLLAGVVSLGAPRASAQQAAPDVGRGFRLTLAAGPSAVYRGARPSTLPRAASEPLAGAGGNGRYLALGLVRPVGRAMVFGLEAAYDRLTSAPNSYVALDSGRLARAALRDETLAVGATLRIRWREDRTQWAPYLVTGTGASLGRLGTNADASAAGVSERHTLLRAGISYGLGVDLPLRRGRSVTGAFAEVRMHRMVGPAHGSEFVPLSLGLRF